MNEQNVMPPHQNQHEIQNFDLKREFHTDQTKYFKYTEKKQGGWWFLLLPIRSHHYGQEQNEISW